MGPFKWSSDELYRRSICLEALCVLLGLAAFFFSTGPVAEIVAEWQFAGAASARTISDLTVSYIELGAYASIYSVLLAAQVRILQSSLWIAIVGALVLAIGLIALSVGLTWGTVFLGDLGAMTTTMAVLSANLIALVVGVLALHWLLATCLARLFDRRDVASRRSIALGFAWINSALIAVLARWVFTLSL